jgi:hypothetical protein
MHASQARSQSNFRAQALQLPGGTTFLYPKAGFVQIRPSGKSGTPPCKSGQLEKDLGLEASALRHAARLIIFEIMRSFFVGSKEQATTFAALHCGERTEPSARSPSVFSALLHFDFDRF